MWVWLFYLDLQYGGELHDFVLISLLVLGHVPCNAPGQVVEVTRAVALAADLHVPIDEQLGRDLTRVDLAALSALKKAQGDAWSSDEKIRETKREQERKAARSGVR